MTSKIFLGTLLTATLLASGCVVAPATVPAGRPYYYSAPVMVAPPPPQVEYVGPQPMPGYLWIGGFWAWNGGRHEWVSGHWEAPRPGYAWVPHRWEREGDHWRQHGGRWEEDRGHRPGHREHRD